jgi:hypothetical protein
MPYVRVWSFLYASTSILVIYALAAHGGLEIPAQFTGGTTSGDTPPASDLKLFVRRLVGSLFCRVSALR